MTQPYSKRHAIDGLFMYRLLAKDDVFAMPSASTGDADSVLQSLYSTPGSPASPLDLMYFKVMCLEPDCGTSCAIDFQRTNLMLEVILHV